MAVSVTLGLLLVAYATGFIERRHQDKLSSPLRQLFAMSGSVLIVEFALVSPLGDLAHHLLSAHMSQHVLLMLIAAPLFVWARPKCYLTCLLPARLRGISDRRISLGIFQMVRFLEKPAPTWGIFCGMVLIWHIPTVYRWAMIGEFRHSLMLMSFFAAALLFWCLVMEPAARRRVDYASSALYVFSAALVTGLPGALIAFTSHSLYVDQFDGSLPFGLTALADQQLAGLIMWIPMDLILFGAALALLGAALGRNPRRERTVDIAAMTPSVCHPIDAKNARDARDPDLALSSTNTRDAR